ncbi:hypothetical protein J6A64_00225 [bacterium]|nr:hypothetical protein [bacterium]
MQICIQNFYPQVNNNYQIKNTQKFMDKPILASQLMRDTVSFCSLGVEFLNLPKNEIMRKIRDSIREENLLGRGVEGQVYAIDGTDYCLKYSQNTDSLQTLSKSFRKRVSDEDRINHIVARLGNDAVIMKKIKGVSVADINRLPVKEYNESIEKLLKFPNSAYRDLLNQIIEALKHGMEYDCHGGNLIVDFENKKLTAIDFYSPRKLYNSEALFKVYSPFLNEGCFEKIYQPFLDINYFDEDSKRLLGKKIMYMLLAELKPEVQPKLDFQDIDVLPFLCDLANVGTIKINQLLAQISDGFNELVDLKERELAGADVYEQIYQTNESVRKLVNKCFYIENPKRKEISFTGRKIPLLDLPKEEVLKLVKQSINPKNGIGIGGEADVYAIPNTDYCVRLIGLNGDSRHFATRYKDYTAEFSKDLTPQEKVNHTVIRLGNGASIMRKIEGEPVYSFFRTQEEQLEAAKEIANFPIEAFSGLLRQIASAVKVGVGFDPHAANIIANFKNKTLTAIDFQEYCYRSAKKPLCTMLKGLKTVEDEEINSKLLNKVFLAALEEFKPKIKPCFDIDVFDFSRLLFAEKGLLDEKLFHRLKYHKALELKGRNVGDELQQIIEDISIKYTNM